MLGKGGFCSVRRALHTLTGQAVACKIIEKGKLKVGGTGLGVARLCAAAMRNACPASCCGWQRPQGGARLGCAGAACAARAGADALTMRPLVPPPPGRPPPRPALQDPKDRDRVDRECRVMRNLSNHVAVVKLFEYVETRDYVYIMMEAAKRG